MEEGPVSSSASPRVVPPAPLLHPIPGPAAYSDAVPGTVRFRAVGYRAPRVHLSLTSRRRRLPLPETGPDPPLRRGGAPGTEMQGQAHWRSCDPHYHYRPAPGASTLPPLGGVAGPHRHPHPRYLLPPLLWPQLWEKRGGGRTHEASSAPLKPAPFTTPLGLQTVTLATNLPAASRAPAGPGRGVRSLEPPLPGPAPRVRPRPPPPRRAFPLGHVLSPPPPPSPAATAEAAEGPVNQLEENCRCWPWIGPRHAA